MPSRVTIFHSHWGTPIAEITAATTRSWVLNGVGRCQFNLATFTDTNCRREILQYGNLVLVEHIPTQDGLGNTRGQLPDWVGIILPPQEWNYGLLTVTAYSAEQILKKRPMPYIKVAGSAGGIFQQIIAYCKFFGGYPILPGHSYSSSVQTSQDLRLSALEELQTLAGATTQDFNVTPVVGVGRKLDLFANWYHQVGVSVGGGLTEGINGNMKLPKLTEQGDISNVTEGYNSSNDPSTRIHAEAIDTDSEADYNRLGQNQNFNVQGQAAVQGATTSYNNLHTRPTITLDLVALDAGKTFDGIAVGNIWDVTLKSVGFFNGAIGFQAPARITGMEYDDMLNEVTLTTQVLTAGLTEANYA